jgi:uncharacterized protein YmfQ (DUF2313 family)
MERYLSVFKQLLPSGSLWEVNRGSGFEKLLGACAKEFSRIHDRAQTLLLQCDPGHATEMLPDWERILDLKPQGPITERQQKARAEYTQDYSSSAESLVRAARDAGFTIEIENPDLTQVIFAPDWALTLTIICRRLGRMRRQEGDPLNRNEFLRHKKAQLQDLINRIKPAHIRAIVRYI